MKKTLKFLGFALVGIVAAMALVVSYIAISSIPKYKVDPINHSISSTPQMIERGKKLVSMTCVGCHLNSETGKLTGKRMLDVPAEFGEVYAPSITQDKVYGIGEWTEGELLYLLRTGIKRDGQYSPPYMAKFPTMADQDIDAIIAYLKSSDQMVAPNATPDQPSKPSLLTKILCRVAFKPFPMPSERINLPDTTDLQALGKYLAVNLDCFSCHSADFKTNDFLNPELSEGYFGGGNKPLDQQGRVIVTSNLTPDKETGIGNWSKEQFIKAVKYGIKEGEPSLRYPMTPYTQLTDLEAGAIYEYLQTIPEITHTVTRTEFE